MGCGRIGGYGWSGGNLEEIWRKSGDAGGTRFTGYSMCLELLESLDVQDALEIPGPPGYLELLEF